MLVLAETPLSLLSALTGTLAQVRDPRARHWLVLPGRGRAEYVLHQWARTTGIASRSQEVQLREVLEQAASGTNPRFDFDRLRLAVAAALPDAAHFKNLPIPSNLPLSPINSAVLDWAGSLARAIDETMLCRPKAERWEHGSFLDSLTQHSAVAETLQFHLGSPSHAQFAETTRLWIDSWSKRGGVPHLWIQFDAGLPALQFERLMQFIAVFKQENADKLHIFALSPSTQFWADCRLKGRKNSQHGSNGNASEAEGHPGGLLWAFGRCSQDLHWQLADSLLAEGDGGRLVSSPHPPPTLLGQLQLSCRNAAAIPEENALNLSPKDKSLTIHSTRSALRELEVLRDRILEARSEDPSLRYEEILVLLADPKRQAPFVEAAFRLGEKHHTSLPFRILGFGQAVPSPLAESISLLLSKIRGRLTLEDLQLLIENPLISKKFNFQAATETGHDLVAWLKDAQFRWGMDPQHREEFQPITEPRWNLHWAMQRLGLGAIVPADTLDTRLDLADSNPTTAAIERASGLSLTSLAQLAKFIAVLQKQRCLWNAAAPRPIADWNQSLKQLVESLLSCTDPTPAQHQAKLFNTILPNLEKAVSANNPAVCADAYLRLLDEKLKSIAESGSRGPGGICIADLRQYAGVPARMILIAGLDDGAFPRRDERPIWHPLAANRRHGDPSLRDTDRHSLLLAILACTDRLVLGFQGGSDEDAKERPPSTALADLFHAVDAAAAFSDGKPPHQRVLFHHPLNGFSPEAFASSRSSSESNFLSSDYTAAKTLHQRVQLKSFRGPWQFPLDRLPAKDRPALTLKTLHTLFREPASLFLQRLGIRKSEIPETLESGDLLKLNGLDQWTIRNSLLLAQVEGRSLDSVLSRSRSAGQLPRGEIGNEAAAKILGQLPSPPTPPFRPQDRIRRSIRLLLTAPHETALGQDTQDHWPLTGQLRKGWYLAEGETRAHFFSASSKSLKHSLPMIVEALALAASFEQEADSNWLSGVEGHFRSDQTKKDETLSIALPTPAMARALLEELIPLYELALCAPLPFWPVAAEKIFSVADPSAQPARDLIQQALDAGFVAWSETHKNGGAPESESQATRYAFRGCDNPFDWNPNIPHAGLLLNPDLPLAWEVCAFIHQWKLNAGAA